ncbi:hypothetical protein BX666DRAFT_1889477 [Dichotomocladium elegans]|nr:hypothetical protein BX666DRAFT_1889477 [Dichotomocladium elegans]
MDLLQSVAQQTDLATLLGLHLGLALLGSISTCPVYNLPLYFFGTWAYNHHESNSPIKTFTNILAMTILLDIIWFWLHGSTLKASNDIEIPHESGFTFCMIMNIISLIIKPITVMSSIQTIRNRGDSFPVGGQSWSEAGTGNASFPGAYQTVRDGNSEDLA